MNYPLYRDYEQNSYPLKIDFFQNFCLDLSKLRI